ncbi:TPA: ribonuclease HIII [Streptococcus equi subsp. zooepidemicus]|uniref:Ribonuclease HIII n=1 Tax=Streptococcus equi subsp. ruminatorum CECT 5772 TaxID=1051981 RepID=A0A922NUR0_9STRE|nr:ribonuclease HIII [Streptococcus equi]KED04388.1 ribonuclease HIII [Streptococcus equi subsp. ruminatorum CECT 5772]HEL0247265.1 ribonuclease HIII [Streptococcus equi subsp. zooepidemicus]HEL1012539.1 ribonuclease HIII [Streptococcus equi subsp. ruminatorum]HEL1024604.1 ribonuclease HIII [Streptococcus equi subsp. ruminatorum CECT 5772]
MDTLVFKINSQVSSSLIKQLAPYRISNASPYVRLAAKKDGVTLMLYTSGKLVLQGRQAAGLAQELGLQETAADPPSSAQDMPLIGSDEVGNGSYFGGIAVVASFVRPEDHALLRQLGVDDSKNLSDMSIVQIAPVLKKHIQHRALLLSPKKYNEMVGKGKPYNAVSVKVALHNQAIFLLLNDGARPEKIVIDAFTSQANYDKYLQQEKNHFRNPLTFEEKAEGKYLAVAVSSIIARQLFLDNLDKLSQDLGYRLPSGAGRPSDQIASQVLAAYGMAGLEHCAKLHFANTKKAQALLKNQ